MFSFVAMLRFFLVGLFEKTRELFNAVMVKLLHRSPARDEFEVYAVNFQEFLRENRHLLEDYDEDTMHSTRDHYNDDSDDVDPDMIGLFD